MDRYIVFGFHIILIFSIIDSNSMMYYSTVYLYVLLKLKFVYVIAFKGELDPIHGDGLNINVHNAASVSEG